MLTKIRLLVKQSNWREVEQNANLHEQSHPVACLPKQNQNRSTQSRANLFSTGQISFANTLPWRRTVTIGSFTSQTCDEAADSSSDPMCNGAQGVSLYDFWSQTS